MPTNSVCELRRSHSDRPLTSTFSFHPKRTLPVVDRITFNAHIIETGTESWRFKKTLERHQSAARSGGAKEAAR